jgi:hypothetical protein
LKVKVEIISLEDDESIIYLNVVYNREQHRKTLCSKGPIPEIAMEVHIRMDK